MRAIKSTLVVWSLSLPLLLVCAQLGALIPPSVGGLLGLGDTTGVNTPVALIPPSVGGLLGLGDTTGVNIPGSQSQSSSTLSTQSSLTSSTTRATTPLPTTATASRVVSDSSSTSSAPVLAPTSETTPPTTAIASLSSTTDIRTPSSSSTTLLISNQTSSTLNHMSKQHQDLVIILSVILGLLGLVLIGTAICLICRYRHGKAPYRGATPINEEEIQSWRGTTLEQKRQYPVINPPSHVHHPRGVSIESPGWTPTSTRSNNPPPSFLAKAPNSRVGLTDEAVPGADPFVQTHKRQSSRLSKAPPGHSRTKSRRSSTSGKSSRSIGRRQTWYDPDDESTEKETGRTRDLDNCESPETSIFDGISAGGLSPRPKPRSWEKEDEIGRAIA